MKSVLILFFSTLTLAAVAEGPNGSSPAQEQVAQGMNRQPSDSLAPVPKNRAGGSKNPRYHRYHQKKKCKVENRELAREILETY